MAANPGPERSGSLRAHHLIGGAALLLFTLAATYRLDRPGLYYDEMLFVHAATGGGNPLEGFVALRVFDVPIMLMSYIGALKAWLYAPLLLWHEGSPFFLRLPPVLMGLAAVTAVWATARHFVSPALAAIATLLAATAPGFIWTTRLDWGPNAIAALLRILLLLALVRLVTTKRPIWAFVGVLTVGAGVFNKQDFALSALAVALAAAAVYGADIVRAVARWSLRIRAGLLATAALVGLLCAALVLPSATTEDAAGGQLQPPLPLLDDRWELYAASYTGEAIKSFLTGAPSTALMPSLLLVSLPFVMAVVALVAHGLLRRRTVEGEPARDVVRAVVFLCLFQGFLLLALAATRQATGPHHGIHFWPAAPLLAVAAVHLLASRLRRAAAARAALGVTLVVAQAVVTVPLALQLNDVVSRDAVRPLLSQDIYQVASVVQEYGAGGASVLSVDWGSGTQLYALACPERRGRYADPWPTFATAGANLPTVVETYVPRGADTLVVSAATADAPGLHDLDALIRTYRTLNPDAHVVTLHRSRSWTVTWLGDSPPVRGEAQC